MLEQGLWLAKIGTALSQHDHTEHTAQELKENAKEMERKQANRQVTARSRNMVMQQNGCRGHVSVGGVVGSICRRCYVTSCKLRLAQCPGTPLEKAQARNVELQRQCLPAHMLQPFLLEPSTWGVFCLTCGAHGAKALRLLRRECLGNQHRRLEGISI